MCTRRTLKCLDPHSFVTVEAAQMQKMQKLKMSSTMGKMASAKTVEQAMLALTIKDNCLHCDEQ